jgi:hypothetical protein
MSSPPVRSMYRDRPDYRVELLARTNVMTACLGDVRLAKSNACGQVSPAPSLAKSPSRSCCSRRGPGTPGGPPGRVRVAEPRVVIVHPDRCGHSSAAVAASGSALLGC